MTKPLQVLCVVGTSAARSATHTIVEDVARRLIALGAHVDVFDPNKEPLALFNPESSYNSREYLRLKTRVEQADAYVLATPDYHGSISSTLKNFLDHFWQEFAGKLFAQIVCSHEKGLTVIDQLRTVARQCYAWSLPYGVFAVDRPEIVDGRIVDDALAGRLEMLTRDTWVYGALLAHQRDLDLEKSEPGFLAKPRSLRMRAQTMSAAETGADKESAPTRQTKSQITATGYVRS
jgi:FMN reductase